ncbi:glycoside hydrolase domain-containing protein [Sphingobacterium endophyticum]|uniref:glycoside hydrolase domain-containing protein n=1 Tax=Sphingobacterium endophyticum TaxID=2546448 RepID=UPI001E471C59|nr:glycoside hydrolase domain-containing protein [Sphingobacterium endophyticum]
MKINLKKYLHIILFSASSIAAQTAYSQQQPFPPQPLKWNPDQLGNQRAVLKVEKDDKLVEATIPWRNRWVKADQKIIIVDSATNKSYDPSSYLWINNVSGGISFQPQSGKGIYYIYYLPYELDGRTNYPTATYLKNTSSASNTEIKTKNPKAKFLRLESVDNFNANTAMETIASEQEVNFLLNLHKNEDYLVFPETRDNPVKMRDYLPKRWTEKNFNNRLLRDRAELGGYHAFQVAVYPIKTDLKNLHVAASDLKNESGQTISKSNFDCINQEGIAYTGLPLINKVNVTKGQVQSLWCGFTIPEDTKPGTYKGIVTLTADNGKPKTIELEIEVGATKLTNKGYDEPWKMTRLPWLNSTLAHANTILPPYTAVQVKQDSILSILGREVVLNSSGLPKQIRTYFTPEMTEISDQANSILEQAMHFKFTGVNGKDEQLSGQGFQFTQKEEGLYGWKSQLKNQNLQVDLDGTLEFDGYMHYVVKVQALQDIDLSDISLEIPFQKDQAAYLMGLGQKGGYRPSNIDWKWDVAHKNQDGAWIGAVNAGLQFSLRDEHYERPLNTNFYLQKPLKLPTSWGNENKGGITIKDINKRVLVKGYSGARTLKKGDVLYYNFNLLITPFHPIQTDEQWNERYYHAYHPVDSVKKGGANVINIHHANDLNPYINYPFIATKEMKNYIDSAHQEGLKVKIYNTVREVSNRVYELYPLRSLGHEVFSAGPGKGYSWLQEHVGEDYIAAWYVPKYQDAALINSGMNRWHNYYVEGMNWLVDKIGIDGIYLDDVAFDRITMKRIKRVMTKNGHPGLIDLHSANQYNERDGFNNSANLYMEHFPYINRLWFGEYFDYEKNNPDFFLTEVSGIPFGLMGEMLQDGGNPYRGMIYGMTNRLPYQKSGPQGLWKVWDDFGIVGSKMIGYWSPNNPVKTDRADVLTTVFQKNGKTMVAIASWAPNDTDFKLKIDWEKLGLDPKKVKIRSPFIKDFQEEKTFDPQSSIAVKKNQGWLLIIE